MLDEWMGVPIFKEEKQMLTKAKKAKEKEKKINWDDVKMVVLEDLPEWAKEQIPETTFKCLLCGETHKGIDHKC